MFLDTSRDKQEEISDLGNALCKQALLSRHLATGQKSHRDLDE